MRRGPGRWVRGPRCERTRGTLAEVPVPAWRFAAGCLLALAACAEKSEPGGSPRPLPPAPLAPLEGRAGAGTPEDRELAYRLAPAPVLGEEPPAEALELALDGRRARLEGEDHALDSGEAMRRLRARLKARRPVLLTVQGDAFLAQAAPALEALDLAGAEVWIRHPAEPRVAFPVLLRDEAAFQRWLDEPKPGKVRVIQRADGFELATNIGKLPGADPNGPTVPTRGGQMDVATLRKGLGRLRERFSNAEDACLVPSFGTELQAVARALSGFWSAPGEPVFPGVCLVYPAPRAGR